MYKWYSINKRSKKSIPTFSIGMPFMIGCDQFPECYAAFFGLF